MHPARRVAAVGHARLRTRRHRNCEDLHADRVAARVVLIDGITLAQLMVTHNIGVQDRETYVIKRVDEDFFEET